MALPKTPAAATALGVIAPVCWGASIPLVRGIAEEFGMAQGQFVLYTIAAVYLFLTVGLPDFRRMKLEFWILGIGSAIACSLTLVFSIFLSEGGKQTVEVGMINYLWPAMTILFTVLFTGQKADWRLAPGIGLSLFGVFWILSGGEFSAADFAARFMHNPWSYILAFFGALTWTIYSTACKLWGNGQNPSALIFMILSAIYGGLWAAGVAPSEVVTTKGVLSAVLGGLSMGTAYVVWTNGFFYGHINILSIASYFTPVLSCLIGVFWLNAELNPSFWTGVAVLTTGSLICWRSTYVPVSRSKST